jgi:hypothetical protein
LQNRVHATCPTVFHLLTTPSTHVAAIWVFVLFFNGYLMYFLSFVCIMLLLCCVGYCLPFVLWIYPLAETFVIVNFPYHLSIINNIKTIKKRKGQVQIACPPLSHFREYKDQVFPPKIAIEIHIYRPERWRGFSYAHRINLGGRR